MTTKSKINALGEVNAAIVHLQSVTTKLMKQNTSHDVFQELLEVTRRLDALTVYLTEPN